SSGRRFSNWRRADSSRMMPCWRRISRAFNTSGVSVMRVAATGQMPLAVTPALPGAPATTLGGPPIPALGAPEFAWPGIAEQARARGEGDDAPGALLAHDRSGVTDAVEGALQVHAHHAVELLLAHVEDHAVAQEPGAGHQDVEPPEGIRRGGDDARCAA